MAAGAAYNGDGARLRQIANGVPTTYTLDLAAPLVTALTERTGATTRQYLYGLSDSPMAVYTSTPALSGVEGWTYLSGRDGLNSVRQETDAAGNVLTARSFDPYGVPLQGGGGQPFGYTGEMADSTGLVFLRARYMQPGLGMFLSRDPALAGFVQSGNGFNYVDGNPINQVDPTGLCPLPNGCRPFSQVYVQDRQDVRSMGGLALRRYPSTREESVIRRFPVGTLAIPMPVGPFRFFDRLWQYVAVSGEFGFLPEWNLKDQIEYLSETAPTSGGGTPPIQDLSGFKFGPLFRGGYRVLAEYGSDNPLTFQQWLPDLGRKGHNGVDLVPTTEVPEDPCKNKVPGREVLSPVNGTLDIYNPDGSPSYPASNPAGITLDIQSIHGYPDLRVQLTHVYPSVENGPVQSGAPIDYYAQIGSSNYPHVHLTMFWKKELHDPTPYLP